MPSDSNSVRSPDAATTLANPSSPASPNPSGRPSSKSPSVVRRSLNSSSIPTRVDDAVGESGNAKPPATNKKQRPKKIGMMESNVPTIRSFLLYLASERGLAHNSLHAYRRDLEDVEV